MGAADVVTASLHGLELDEVVVAPGVEDTAVLNAVFAADLAAFDAQGPQPGLPVSAHVTKGFQGPGFVTRDETVGVD